MRKEVFGLVSEAIANMTLKPNDNDRHGVAQGLFDQHTRFTTVSPPRHTPVPGAGRGTIYTPATPIISLARSPAPAMSPSAMASAGMRAPYTHTGAYPSVFLQYATLIFAPTDEHMMAIPDSDAQYQSVRRVVHEHITLRRMNPDIRNLWSNDLAYALRLST
jgi:hypothetical protein